MGISEAVRISIVIPTVANALLAALWVMSVFAGWGTKAFCSDAGCAARMNEVALVSGLFAAVAVCCTAAAWLPPAARRDDRRLMALTGAAAAAWTAAVGTVFAGGMIVR
ncbi:hypothetical protein [Planomonospora venezuelensis]|uniref:Uncharacterized protein n=1 Tax=Planomonospora venezuelensis TaxID=1999 RepID=A0A841D3L7_PLAVE|nr:hypothetical protein [Planomonospora venezuelensis]MBB5965262.1 hypothetical protein [Planomonospora venezuelensis]GIN00504.1 hypothetical protein Pve01_21620 [Planomonospora venezuelensis]